MRMNRHVGFVAFALLSLSTPALAWKLVHAGANGATIYATASTDATVVQDVPAGTAMNVGDKPTNGFYRCSAAGGISGWVKGEEIGLAVPKHAGAPAAAKRGAGGAMPPNTAAKWTGYVGPLLGLGFYSPGAAFSFGADGGFRLSNNIVFGGYVTYASLASASSSSGSVSASASVTQLTIAPEIQYYLDGDTLKGIHLGGKLGIAIVSAGASGSGTATVGGQTVTVNTASVSASGFGFVLGVGGGYDYPVVQNITVGGELNYLLGVGSAAGAFNALVSGKYWF
jgi:hypothetical protein